jgi:hypothetical protein
MIWKITIKMLKDYFNNLLILLKVIKENQNMLEEHLDNNLMQYYLR